MIGGLDVKEEWLFCKKMDYSCRTFSGS